MKSLLKKIIAIIKINILILASYTSSAQATTTFIDAFSLVGQEDEVTGFSFNDDGSKMFVVGTTGDDVNEYTLAQAYDVSTAVFVDSVDISAFSVSPSAITFNDIGDKIYIVDDIGNQIHEFDLAAAFDVSTLIVPFVPVVVDLAPDLIVEPSGIAFNNDGTKMFITDRATGLINEYVLLGGYDIGTAGLNSTFDFTAQDAGPEGIAFNNNGTKMFFIGVNTTVYEYALTTAFDVTSASFTDSFDVSSQDTETTSVEFNGDGTKMFVLGNASSNINEYTLSVAFDLVTSSSGSLANPTNDKDVVGSIEAQVESAKTSLFSSLNTVSNRLSYLRRNRSNDNLANNGIDFKFSNKMLASINDATSETQNELLDFLPKDWSLWTAGEISVHSFGDENNKSSREIDAGSISLGVDKKINDNQLYGFAIQYGDSEADIGSSGTSVDSENISLSIYGTKPHNDDQFIEGLIGVGKIDSDLKRVSGVNTLTGQRDGQQIFSSINYGKKIEKDNRNITPLVKLNLGYTELDEYSETGTNALKYHKQTFETGLISTGFEIDQISEFKNSTFKPYGALDYSLDFSSSSNAKMNYVSDSSTIYTYSSGGNSTNYLNALIGFDYSNQKGLSVNSSYKRKQGDNSEKADIFNFGLNFVTKRETEYALKLDQEEKLYSELNIGKNINGFDFSFNTNQIILQNPRPETNISISSKF